MYCYYYNAAPCKESYLTDYGPLSGPSVKFMSVQFRNKDIVRDSVKYFAQIYSLTLKKKKASQIQEILGSVNFNEKAFFLLNWVNGTQNKKFQKKNQSQTADMLQSDNREKKKEYGWETYDFPTKLILSNGNIK